jgi:hypothetical protein
MWCLWMSPEAFEPQDNAWSNASEAKLHSPGDRRSYHTANRARRGLNKQRTTVIGLRLLLPQPAVGDLYKEY